MGVRTCHVDGIAALGLGGDGLAVVVVPELGGKLCSIVWQGRELLARNPLRPARYAAPVCRLRRQRLRRMPADDRSLRLPRRAVAGHLDPRSRRGLVDPMVVLASTATGSA